MECFFNGFAETQLRTLLWNFLSRICAFSELAIQFKLYLISAAEVIAPFLKVDQRVAIIEATHSHGNSDKSKHCDGVSEPFALPAVESQYTRTREEAWRLHPAT